MLDDVGRVRAVIAERIPEGGYEADTMFSDEQIQDWIDTEGSGSVNNRVYLAGWRAKAAEYANLVDVSEGNSTRAFSDLLKNATAMVEYYQEQVDKEGETTGTSRRVVIGKISRGRSY